MAGRSALFARGRSNCGPSSPVLQATSTAVNIAMEKHAVNLFITCSLKQMMINRHRDTLMNVAVDDSRLEEGYVNAGRGCLSP